MGELPWLKSMCLYLLASGTWSTWPRCTQSAALSEELQTESFLSPYSGDSCASFVLLLSRVAKGVLQEMLQLPEHCIPLLKPSHCYMHRAEHIPSPPWHLLAFSWVSAAWCDWAGVYSSNFLSFIFNYSALIRKPTATSACLGLLWHCVTVQVLGHVAACFLVSFCSVKSWASLCLLEQLLQGVTGTSQWRAGLLLPCMFILLDLFFPVELMALS